MSSRVLPAASGDQVAALFASWEHDGLWADNWSQSLRVNDRVPGTSTTIQGVLSCIDLDVTMAWLLMLVDPVPAELSATGRRSASVRYLACSFNGELAWPWVWLDTDSNLGACAAFVDWVRTWAAY